MFKKTREKSPFFLVAMDFGYTLLAAIAVFGYIGYVLDGRYQKTPLFMIGGIFLGLAVGFNSLFKRLNRLEAIQKQAKDREKPPPDPKP